MLRTSMMHLCRLSYGLLLATTVAHAAQVDIAGPAGSVAFGALVKALPNGNFVVVDPKGIVSEVGAVHLYSANGSLISTITGAAANDHIGSGGIRVVGNSNFLILSPEWHSGANSNAGAVTWVNGTTGLNGVVSALNSLVGSSNADHVGQALGFVKVLANGNYVVQSRDWDNGGVVDAGAATWGSGNSGVSGVISAANSLIGTTAGDRIGSVTAVGTSNYVVSSSTWDAPGPIVDTGSVTWVDGSSGLPRGAVSTANSLVGGLANNSIGSGVTALSDGNYMVCSPGWDTASLANVGAATWGNGATGTIGTVSPANSLVGTKNNDSVCTFARALGAGNYVVLSSNWGNGAATGAGAATWCAGGGPCIGQVSGGNSIVGTTTDDNVGYVATVLANGNYVLSTPGWGATDVGAVTWASGAGPTSMVVSGLNSLIGTSANDQIGSSFAVALKNGHYVVVSPLWDNGGTVDAGAVTWGNGATGTAGSVSVANSLVGSTTQDRVGGDSFGQVTPLNNGNYVVTSPTWNAGVPGAQRGAVTWVNGSGPFAATVSAANSLVGSTNGDQIGLYGVTALSDSNYIVSSPYWDKSGMADAGAITWVHGGRGLTGAISASNSLVGSVVQEHLGYIGVRDYGDGHYSVLSGEWFNATNFTYEGAITLGDTHFRLKGAITDWNSAEHLGNNSYGSFNQYDYDGVAHRLIMGRPAYNLVTLFTSDQIFAGDNEY